MRSRRVLTLSVVALGVASYLIVQYLTSPDRVAREIVRALAARDAKRLWRYGLLQHQVEPSLDRAQLSVLMARLFPSGLKVSSLSRNHAHKIVNDTRFAYDVKVIDSNGVERKPWFHLYRTEAGWRVDEVALLTNVTVHGEDAQTGRRHLARVLRELNLELRNGTSGGIVNAASVESYDANPRPDRSIFLTGEQPEYRW